ncbi:hypothetical protein F511_31874 [Dorcoceras hygrometricum]|uniref:Uncharacterized protein n=1 Tax=Dorcoceras hygrometricum TaxID=472368 RepID=A0A2Z7CWU6_9LAMI|nr:hypothetical protein F511_31874 [Dorcoceras hygrometricum]
MVQTPEGMTTTSSNFQQNVTCCSAYLLALQTPTSFSSFWGPKSSHSKPYKLNLTST